MDLGNREYIMGLHAMMSEMSGEVNVTEKQEAEEQRRVVRSKLLSRELDLGYGCSADSRPLLELLGFVLGDSGDPLFYQAQFPDSWRIVPTDHSMWTHVTFKDLALFKMFYKGAFYDRSAFLRIACPEDWDSNVPHTERKSGQLSAERWQEVANCMLAQATHFSETPDICALSLIRQKRRESPTESPKLVCVHFHQSHERQRSWNL